VESVGVIYIRADFISTTKHLFGVVGAMTQPISGHYVFLAIPKKPAARTKCFELELSD
jgi:hypothetical protein